MVFRRGKEREIETIVDEEYEPIENYSVLVRFRPNTTVGWIRASDVEPPLELIRDLFFSENPREAEEALREWLKEEYGGGIWRIELLDERGKTARSRTIKIPPEEADITYGVNKWIVYVKGEKSGRWYKADAEFAHCPSSLEIIDAIGGGGKVKLVGYDDRGRIMSTKIMELNAPPPEWLASKEDSLERKILDSINKKLEEEQKKLIDGLIGSKKDEEEDMVDKLISELKSLVDEKKMETVRSLLETLKGGKEDKKTSLTDVLFIEPYKAKVESINVLIKKLADQGRVDEAIKLLQEIPDGTGALINLMTAGATLIEAVALAFTGASKSSVQKRAKEFKEKMMKKEEKKEEKKKEEEIEEKVEEKKEEVEEEKEGEEGSEMANISLEEREEEGGWSLDISYE